MTEAQIPDRAIAARIERLQQNAIVFQQEALHWAGELARAREAGSATPHQVQAVSSGLSAVRSNHDALRAILATSAEITDDEAETVVSVSGRLAQLESDFAGMLTALLELFPPGPASKRAVPPPIAVQSRTGSAPASR